MSGSEFEPSLHPCTLGWRVKWPELAELAADAGFRGAVIARDQPLPAELSNAVRATAMLLPAEVRRDEAAYRDSLLKMEAACRFAAAAGCRVATLSLPPSAEHPRAEQSRIYRERLKPCCEVLDQYGIRLALECVTPVHLRGAHPYPFLMRNDEMLEFGLTVSPRCGLVIDAWHWHHAGSDRDWLVGIADDQILDVHISDSPTAAPEDVRDTERLLPGEGVIDFPSFLDFLSEKNYRGALTVEVFGAALSAMSPADAAKAAFEASCGVLRKAGYPTVGARPRRGDATRPDPRGA